MLNNNEVVSRYAHWSVSKIHDEGSEPGVVYFTFKPAICEDPIWF
jgi:hypothetical protein